MIGRTLAHYEILDSLGEGAMGAVYRALDTRLRRKVAIKVLSGSDFSSADERKRLLGEARAAASLNHPAIATVFEVGDHEDLTFIVMELVEGGTLTARIGRMGADPLGLARLGLAAVQGLRAAHDAGVVHGDIKPDNLMVRPDGGLKILDFGVSRRLPSADLDALRTIAETIHEGGADALDGGTESSLLVGPGQIAGTLAYMPPEQMRGEPIDGRADLYSLAVVLQELATGRRPFAAPSPLAVMAQAMIADSGVVEELGRSQPGALTRVLTRMLSNSPADRHASAQEAEVDFEMAIATLESSTATHEEAKRVVAVLPFQLLAADADDEFLRIALAQAVTHGLAKQGTLAVRPTSAVTRYLEGSYDPAQVAADLKAQVLVEGTIQKLGPSLRVQVQAWDAEAGETLLSAQRDAAMDQLFDLQDLLAHDIGEGLAGEGMEAAGEPTTDRRRDDVDPESYELYLRAGERLLRMTDYDTRNAIQQLERAVTLDAGFADAWARLAGAQHLMSILFEPTEEMQETAMTSVARALELDPGNPEAWAAKGRLLWSPHEGYRHEDSLRHLGAACRHHAPPQDGMMWYGAILAHVGLHEEAEHWVTRALEEQPEDLLARLVMGEVISWRGDFEQGAEHYGLLMKLDPSNIFTQLWYPVGLIYAGEIDEAERAIERAQQSFGEDALFHAAAALIAARRGEVPAAREAIITTAECIRSVSHQHHAFHYAGAAAAEIGDADRAVELLRRATDTGFPNYPAFKVDPHLSRIESSPAFIDLMDDVEGRWRHFQAGFGGVPELSR